MPADAAPPAWLQGAFPDHAWKGLQRCALRVRAEGGAGVDMEASEHGYLIEDIDADAGQEKCLQPGGVVVEIEAVPLMGLSEDELGEIFGKHFKDGAQILVLQADELREASLKHDPSWGVVQVTLPGVVADDKKQAMENDLGQFATKNGVRATTHGGGEKLYSCVMLAGAHSKVNAARPELGALLSYYGAAASAEKRKADDMLEVDGMVLYRKGEELEVAGMMLSSMPARNRRRRIAKDVDEEEEEAAAGDAKDAGGGTSARRSGDAPSKRERELGAVEAVDPEKLPVGELQQYEYMDHTADVILHSWGTSIEQALAQVCEAFFGYMTDLDKVEMKYTFEVEASGRDITDMLYHLQDEFLFHWGTNWIMCRRVEVVSFDWNTCKVRARGYGDKFDLSKHTQGTEIKAITMHQLKILTPETISTEEGTVPRVSDAKEGGSVREGFPYECYILVDI